MNKIKHSKIAGSGFGLTNQIFCLITDIIKAYNEKKNIVVVDKFSNDFSKNNYTCISEILDIDKTNIYLKNKYNIILVDKFKFKFIINSVQYGYENNSVDLTDFITSNCFKNNCLSIKKDINLNNIKGDPFFDHFKYLYINYSINNYSFNEKLQEKFNTLENDFVIDLSLNNNNNDNTNVCLSWINSINQNIFEDLLKNIHYHNCFINFTNEYIKYNINLNDKVNVLHLRLEDDAITHWSKMNNMSTIDYKNYIENKYIEIIKKYVKIDEQNILLTSSSSNSVINFLKNNNYNYKLTNKFFDDREKNAIIDLLLSQVCNNIFIGNFNLKKLNGSTFTYYISQKINNDIKKIMIDLDRITDPECEY